MDLCLFVCLFERLGYISCFSHLQVNLGVQIGCTETYLGRFFEYFAGFALKRVTARVLLK